MCSKYSFIYDFKKKNKHTNYKTIFRNIYVNIIFKHVCKIEKELFALHFIVLDYIIQLIPIILSHLVSQNNGGLNTV